MRQQSRRVETTGCGPAHTGSHPFTAPAVGRWKLYDALRQGRLRSLRAAAGLRRSHFHDLRRAFATLQLANNQPLKIVREMMGQLRHAQHFFHRA